MERTRHFFFPLICLEIFAFTRQAVGRRFVERNTHLWLPNPSRELCTRWWRGDTEGWAGWRKDVQHGRKRLHPTQLLSGDAIAAVQDHLLCRLRQSVQRCCCYWERLPLRGIFSQGLLSVNFCSDEECQYYLDVWLRSSRFRWRFGHNVKLKTEEEPSQRTQHYMFKQQLTELLKSLQLFLFSPSLAEGTAAVDEWGHSRYWWRYSRGCSALAMLSGSATGVSGQKSCRERGGTAWRLCAHLPTSLSVSGKSALIFASVLKMERWKKKM